MYANVAIVVNAKKDDWKFILPNTPTICLLIFISSFGTKLKYCNNPNNVAKNPITRIDLLNTPRNFLLANSNVFRKNSPSEK